MATDLLLKQQRAEFRKKFFMLLQNDVPEGFDRERVERELRDLAAGLVLKGVITKEEWAPISQIENRNQQLLEIIDLVLSKANETNDQSIPANLDELVKDLEKHQEQKRKEAEVKLAQQPSPHEQAEKIIAAQRKAVELLAKDHPEAAEALSDIQTEVGTGIVNNPDTAIPAAAEFVVALAHQKDPQYNGTDASIHISPLVEPAQDFSQQIDAVTKAVEITLPTDLPENIKEEIAQSIVAYKLRFPQAKTGDFKELTEKIELDQAARNGVAVTVPDAAIATAVAFETNLTTDKLVMETVRVALQQSGVPETTSTEIAQVIAKFGPAIHYVSSFAPAKTAKEYEKNKKEVTTKLSNFVVDRLLASPRSPQSLLRNIREGTNKLDFYRLFTSAYGPAQFFNYQPEVVTYPSHPEVQANDPKLTYLYSYARNYAQDALVGATLDLVVAGPIGAWILPDAALSAAFVFDAGISAAPAVGATIAAGATPPAVVVGAEVAVGAAGAGAGAGTGTATGGLLGTLLGPWGIVIGAAIGAVVGWIVANKDKVWKWIKNKFEEYVFPLIGGLLLLGITVGGAILAGFSAAATAAVGILGFGAGAMVGSQIPTFISGGAQAVLRPVGQFAGAVFGGLVELAVVEIATPIIIIILSVPVVVALLLFIINSSSYVVPASSVYPGNVGSLPGCPAEMWPVTLEQDQKYVVTQGPGGPGSHGPPGAKVYEEAIDIFPLPYNPNLNLIVATHPGVVTRSEVDGWGGNYIFLQDSCGGDFQTSYVHQLVNYVKKDQVVNTGDIIGVMGYTGHVSSRSVAGAHLHYAFLDTDFSWKNRGESPPFMIVPYIPKTVPIYCLGVSQCNTSIP